MTIYSLDVLLSQFGTGPLGCGVCPSIRGWVAHSQQLFSVHKILKGLKGLRLELDLTRRQVITWSLETFLVELLMVRTRHCSRGKTACFVNLIWTVHCVKDQPSCRGFFL